jgi:hypothetical protein
VKHLIIIYQFCLEHYPKLRELAQAVAGLARELARRLRETEQTGPEENKQ